jgi:hypothetical protein
MPKPPRNAAPVIILVLKTHLNMELPYDLTVPLLGIAQKK